MAKKYNNKYENTRVSNKLQKGGLAPLLVPIIASIAGALVGKIYDTIRSKIKGKEHKMPNHITEVILKIRLRSLKVCIVYKR